MERIRPLKLSRSDKDKDQRGPRRAATGHVNPERAGETFLKIKVIHLKMMDSKLNRSQLEVDRENLNGVEEAICQKSLEK